MTDYKPLLSSDDKTSAVQVSLWTGSKQTLPIDTLYEYLRYSKVVCGTLGLVLIIGFFQGQYDDNTNTNKFFLTLMALCWSMNIFVIGFFVYIKVFGEPSYIQERRQFIKEARNRAFDQIGEYVKEKRPFYELSLENVNVYVDIRCEANECPKSVIV